MAATDPIRENPDTSRNVYDATMQAMHEGSIEARLDALGEKVDSLGQLGEKVDELARRMEKGFERVDERFEKVDERFEKLEGRFDRLQLTMLAGALGIIAALVADCFGIAVALIGFS